jgi:ABC-type transporter Mla subunit MlaD
MGEDKSQVGATVSGEQEKSPDEIRHEIEQTREQLGDTAAALAAKTDVKARAKEKVEGVKQTVSEKTEAFTSNAGGGGAGGATSPVTQVKAKAQQNPIPTAAIAAFVGGFLFGRLTSR